MHDQPGNNGSHAKERSRGPAARREGGNAIKTIAKMLGGFGYAHDRHRVFSDCMEAMAIAISNAVDQGQQAGREARYLDIVRRYERSEVEGFCRVLAELTHALGAGPADVLGAVFGELEVQNTSAGQFFTPFEVCRLMGRLTVGDGEGLREQIAKAGYIRAHEPAVGAGAMVIALAEAMQEAGFNYQRQLHVTAVDVDTRAAHMAYVQFSLLHIPAVVVVGNSITLEEREHWYTPAHVLGGWSWKLARRQALQEEAAGPTPEEGRSEFEARPMRMPGRPGADSQLTLF